MAVSAQTFLLESRRRLIHVIAQVLTVGCISTIGLLCVLLGVLNTSHILISYLYVLAIALVGSGGTLLLIHRWPLGWAMLPLVSALIGGVALSSCLLSETTLVSIPLLSLAVLIISIGQSARMTSAIGGLCTVLGALLASSAPRGTLAPAMSIGAALPGVYVIGASTLILTVWLVANRLIKTSHAAIHLADQHLSTIDQRVDVALAQIGSFMGADRAYLLQYTSDQSLHATHSWHASVAPPQRHLQTVPITSMRWWMARLEQAEIITLPQVRRLPEEARVEQTFLLTYGIHALVAAPIMLNQEIIGMVWVIASRPKPRWRRENHQLLTIVAHIIGQTLEHHHVQQALQESEARYRLLAEHATDIIMCHTPQGITRYCSPASCIVLGIVPAALTGHLMWEHALLADQEALASAYHQLVEELGTVTVTYRAQHSDGTECWLEATAHAVSDMPHGPVREIVTVIRDVTQRRMREEQVTHLAHHDALTGLANRRQFHHEATLLLANAAHETSSFALLYLDLDRFKMINDTMGHAVGDEFLVQVAERLRSCLREGDILARLGGDEFAILLPHTDGAQATMIAQRLLDRFTRPFLLQAGPVYGATSIGIACFPDHGTQIADLLKHADVAMYRAKREGAHYQHYEAFVDTLSPELLMLEVELREAITNDGLVLYYQPIVDLQTLHVVGVEALIRWEHPQRGLLGPSQFIPVAEEGGFIRALDRWVVRRAIAQMHEWAADAPSHVAVNLSMRSLHDRNLAPYIAECLRESGVTAAQLSIEITESAMMDDLAMTRQVLGELQVLGLHVALDDFGTEYASLRHLKALPVHALKIDSTFVQGIGRDAADEAIARAVLALGHGLQLDVIAEGVTNEPQRTWLLATGCRYAQGFGLAEPRPAAQIPQLRTVTLREVGSAPANALSPQELKIGS